MKRNYSIKFLLVLLAFVFHIPLLYADKLDKAITSYMQQYKIPGAAVAVMRDGKLIKAKGYGWTNKAKRIKASPQQLFRIASVSKIVTGVSILQLIQAGKLHYQTKAFPLLQIKPLAKKQLNKVTQHITVRDLLLMAGGWGNSFDTGIDLNFGPLPWIATHKYHLKAPLTCYQTARLAQIVPLSYQPGTHFAYANPNFCLLGLLISKVNHLPYTPKAYENYIQRTLLTPLGISDMRIGNSSKSLPNEVHYYAAHPNKQLPYGKSNVLQKTYAFGGWLASPIDLAKLMNGIPELLDKKEQQFIRNKPKHICYEDKKSLPQHFYSSGFWLYPQKRGLAWVGHGGFTGTRAIVVKQTNGTIVALIFNKRPLPNRTALRQLITTLLIVQ